MVFINKTHQDRFDQMLAASKGIKLTDEYLALFYIFSSTADIYFKIEHIYNFEKHTIRYYQKTDERGDTFNYIDGVFSISAKAMCYRQVVFLKFRQIILRL